MSEHAIDTRSVQPSPPRRGADVERLESLYHDVQRGDRGPRLALLVGPSDLGKARLLGELRGRVRLAGGVLLEGRCQPGRAFGPFADIVERGLRFLDEVGVVPRTDLSGLGCAEGCHGLWHQHRTAEDWDARATGETQGPYGATAHGATANGATANGATANGATANGATAHGATAHGATANGATANGATAEAAAFEQRLRFFDAVASLLREVAAVRAPVVVIDGLERADRGTRDLLAFLVEEASTGDGRVGEPLRALFVAASRETGPVETHPRAGISPTALKDLKSLPATLSIEVGALDPASLRAYLQSDAAIAMILERTGGIPENIELLLEGEPLTPQARVQRRLEDLSAEARALVEALAVLGRPAAIDELGPVAGVTPNSAIAQAVARCDLLDRSMIDGQILFSFEREGDVEHILQALDERERRALHRRAADACAETGHLEQAVRHALRGDEADRAADLASLAAASLSARHAHAEAAILLEQVIGALPADRIESHPAQLRAQLADLYRVAGDYRAAIRHARAAVHERPDLFDRRQQLGYLLTVAGDHEEAGEVLEGVRADAESAGDARILAETQAQLAELHYQRSDYAQSRHWAERALETAERSEHLLLEIYSRNTLGKLALAQKDPESAAVYFEENLKASTDAGLGHQEAQAHTNLGVAMLVARDLVGAERACRRAIEVAMRASDTRERAIATENLAVLAHLQRDYRQALKHYHEAVALLKRLGNRAMLARVANNLGELYLSLGDHERARGLRDFASHLGRKGLSAFVVGEGLLLAGRVEANDGNITAARDAFERARTLFSDLSSPRAAEAGIELARLALVDGDVPGARAALAELPVQESPKRAAELALVAAEVERAAGGASLAAARRAVEVAEAADDLELLLPALVRHARALGDGGEVGLAARVLDRAQRVEEELTGRVPASSLAAWSERPARAEFLSVAARLANAWSSTRHESVPPPQSLKPRDDGGPRAEVLASRYPEIVGRAPALLEVFGMLDKVSGADATVLIRGESGTGKELIAEAIHNRSPRRTKPLIKVNCAALVETLLLSELFGHERGAFTGASARRKGRFELADGGTLFLDEIGDISPKTQVALLRVLQEREFERVGGTQRIEVDVRIVCATHRDLEAMVKEGAFREDLYYRLRGVVLEMPPLRDRLSDIPILSDHLLHRIAAERAEPAKRLSPEAASLLTRHRWPGNVRELENILRSATLFADGPTLVPDDFSAFAEAFEPPSPAPPSSANASTDRASGEPGSAAGVGLEALLYRRVRDGETSLLEMKKVLERECIARALDETEGNITRAATLLGMKRPRLSQLVKQYGLSKSREDDDEDEG